MGTHFRILVDRTASAKDAPALAGTVMNYLIRRRIIECERSDCTLGDKGGFRPGANVEEALASWAARGDEAGPLSAAVIANDLRGYACNGVEEVVGRTVFHNQGAGLDVVRCPLCLANQLEEDWGDAVGRWYDGDDCAPLPCRHCNESSPIVEWTFDPPWAFGNLGFKFWEWPPLKRRFVDEIKGLLGHEIVMISGKV
ncbi:MAG TPA: hypothetical protein VGY58_11625 [Gemmataceae bacterium]|nr:hypothetical protein [Gemmataceae bacterium]